ncbi:MAG: YdeI/OmpD-associated family protein [Pyrinomonadaceae bacterium]
MKKYNSAEEFIAAQTAWKQELVKLRNILQSTELVEEIKWGHPVYTINGKNVVGLGAFNEYVALWFFKGVFLKDKSGKLLNAQEGNTKSQRQWRMNSINEIDAALIKEYLAEAIANEKAGKKVKPEKKQLLISEELSEAFNGNQTLKKRFDALTPGRQREYSEYVSEAKRTETRISRIEKITPMILEGIGLNDKYRK